MPYRYQWPEVAFEVRIQCTEEEIQRHCDAAPENDRRDFDDRGGLQIPVYHVYEHNNFYDPFTYWYTLDKTERDTYKFDIRKIPSWWNCSSESTENHQDCLQEALDDGLIEFDGLRLTIGNIHKRAQ